MFYKEAVACKMNRKRYAERSNAFCAMPTREPSGSSCGISEDSGEKRDGPVPFP